MTFLRKYIEPYFLLESSARSSLPLKEKTSDGFEPVEVYSGQCFIKIYDRGSANLSFARHVIYDRLFGRTLHIERSYGRKKHRKYMSWGSWTARVLEFVLQHKT